MLVHKINWGDFPAWVLVIVSFFGVGAAICAGRYARKVYEVERGRDQDRLRAEIRSQAVLVSAWAEMQKTRQGGYEVVDLLAVAQNGSNQPIYDVEVFWWLKGKNIHQKTTNLIPPNSPYRWVVQTGVFRGAADFNVGERVSVEEALSLIKESRISITFKDAENRSWTRQQDGRINQTGEAFP